MNVDQREMPDETRPGWREVVTAGVVYFVLILSLGVWLSTMPDDQAALRGIVGMGANGVAGTLALLVAWRLRLRDFSLFGFRAAARTWMLAGIALGVVAFGLSLAIEWVYFMFVTEPNNQADFQAAARAGPLSLGVLIVCGALLTPFGEEVVFRGIVANALNRYGALAGVVGSAAIFGIAHGVSVILLDAFMVGILTGMLFRKTNSIWPGLLTHIVYNGIWLAQYSTD